MARSETAIVSHTSQQPWPIWGSRWVHVHGYTCRDGIETLCSVIAYVVVYSVPSQPLAALGDIASIQLCQNVCDSL